MKLLTILALAITGCTQTTFYRADGTKHFSTSADVTNLRISGDLIAVERLDHSTPSVARGKAVGDRMAGVAGIVTALGASALIP